MHLADGAVTCSLIFATPLVTAQPYGQTSLAGYWMTGCCLYAAVLRGTAAGITATLATAMPLLMIPPRVTISRIDLVLSILLMSICVGVLITQFKHTITEQERARIRSVALGERERLARIVHDGALQVLALVEREGPELGPRGLRLAELAHESETQLRNLIRDKEILSENAPGRWTWRLPSTGSRAPRWSSRPWPGRSWFPGSSPRKWRPLSSRR